MIYLLYFIHQLNLASKIFLFVKMYVSWNICLLFEFLENEFDDLYDHIKHLCKHRAVKNRSDNLNEYEESLKAGRHKLIMEAENYFLSHKDDIETNYLYELYSISLHLFNFSNAIISPAYEQLLLICSLQLVIPVVLANLRRIIYKDSNEITSCPLFATFGSLSSFPWEKSIY